MSVLLGFFRRAQGSIHLGSVAEGHPWPLPFSLFLRVERVMPELGGTLIVELPELTG